MRWEKPSLELTGLLVNTMGAFEAQKKTMFGSTCYFTNNNMFAGVHRDHIFLRLSEQDREGVKELFKDTTQFEPIEGRPMREYVNLSPLLYRDDAQFKLWIARSMNYVGSLPRKAIKVRKVKK